MRFRIPFYTSALLAVILLMSDCKKYDDDDVFLHFKSVKKRLDSGEFWYFDKLLVDASDISESFRNDSAYFEKIDLHIFNHGNAPPPANFYVYRFGAMAAIGDFELSEDKRKITLGAGNCCGFATLSNSSTQYGPIFISTEWEIKKLTKKEFWIETVYGSKKYLLKLKK